MEPPTKESECRRIGSAQAAVSTLMQQIVEQREWVMAESKARAAARRINDSIRWQISVFSVGSALDSRRCDPWTKWNAIWAPSKDLVTRGWYDVGGLRADADVMVWWHSDERNAASGLSRSSRNGLRPVLAPVWSVQALHRPPSSTSPISQHRMADEHALDYVCVYPFVRSYEWYLLEDSERRALLAEHGAMARGYPDVRANTVALFALSDYEWLLAFLRPTSCTGSWISCGTCAIAGAVVMCARDSVLHRRRWSLSDLMDRLP